MTQRRVICLLLGLCPAVGLMLIAAASRQASGDDAKGCCELGSRRELFIDHYLIDKLNNTQLVLHPPKDEGPVIAFNQPWEFPFAGCPTLIKDGTKYRLYYRGMSGTGDGTNVECTCYAESPDGIHWTKPDLGLFEVKGTRHNNCVYANDPPFSHNFTPFLDTQDGVDRQQRFKAVAGVGESKGLWAFASADGIRWKKRQEGPILTEGTFDSQNVAFWSEHEGKYLCYFRVFRNGVRWVARTTSDDFVHWTKPVEMVFRHGGGLAPAEHVYTNGTHPYFRAPHIYIATPFRFMPGRRVLTEQQAKAVNVHPHYASDCSDGILMTSRGGNIYDRTFLESFVRPGIGWQNWASRSNMPGLNVVQTGRNEMSLYVECDYAQPTVHLRRFSMRLDGFASVRGPYEGGEMITHPLTFAGSRLLLNFSTSAAGSIRAEIQDPQGEPLEGYSLDESEGLIGDEIERAVSWKGGADLSRLAGKTVCLRLVLKDADVYALRFAPAQETIHAEL